MCVCVHTMPCSPPTRLTLWKYLKYFNACMCVCVCVCVCFHICIHREHHEHVCVCVCVHICMHSQHHEHVCVCVCLHVCIACIIIIHVFLLHMCVCIINI